MMWLMLSYRKCTLVSIDRFLENKIAWECEAVFASHCHNFLFKKTQISLK